MRQFLKGNNKYFSLFGLSIILIIVIGILSPIIVGSKSENWSEELRTRIETIHDEIISKFEYEQSLLVDFSSYIKNDLRLPNSQGEPFETGIIQKVNDYSTDNVIQIFDESLNQIAWTEKIIVPKSKIFNQGFEYSETFFIKSDLIVFLTTVDTLNVDGREYTLVFSAPIEKEYVIENDYFLDLNFSNSLSDELNTPVEIYYSQTAERSRDGRKYSFDVMNNFNNKIAVVNFQKPNRDIELNLLVDRFDALQSVFTILSIIFLGISLVPWFNRLNNSYVKFTLIGSYIFLIRVAAFFFNIPTRFFGGELTNSAYFSSTFAVGLVRSPLEFFLTGITFLAITVLAYNYTLGYIEHKETDVNQNSGKLKFILIFVLFTALYLIFLRGLGAAVRSVIFDSTIKYFKDPTFELDSPMLLMHLNLLLLGICSIMASVVFVLLVLQTNVFKKNKQAAFFIFFFVFVQIAALLYDLFQSNPQGTSLIRILHILFVFVSAYSIKYLKKRTIFNYILFASVSSIISINLLLYYNSNLEKESLKLTAFEFSRTNESYLTFVVNETLLNSTTSEVAIEAFGNPNTNFDAAAFKLWSSSILQREPIGCMIGFYNPDKERLGAFRSRFGKSDGKYIGEPKSFSSDITVVKENILYSKNAVLRGIAPLVEQNNLLGYLEVTVVNEIDMEGFQDIPPFLLARRAFLTSAVDFSKLSIFDFRNGQLNSSYAEIFLSKVEKDAIVNADYSIDNETWLDISLHGEEHLVYCMNLPNGSENRIIAVALNTNELSWNLFDFFKVFLVHIVLIILLLFGVIISLLWKKKIEYISFRNRLLGAFLVISIIPLIFLAVYFREITETQNLSTISYKLGKRAVKVENYINDYLNTSPLNANAIFQKAERDLGISFSLFKNDKLFFSSEESYYRLGLFSTLLHPIVFDKIFNYGYKEFVIPEFVEGFKFSSYYYQAHIGGEAYTIQVNDLFNSITLPLSDIEMDIFIFSTYSFAAILIILISTIFANQISSPIIRLTKATKSVAGGDLNFELTENYKGEVKGLVDNFNLMIKQLRRSQSELAQMERETAWKEMAKQVAHEIKNPLTPMKLSVQQLIAAYKDKSSKFDAIFERVTETVINQIETLKNIASEFSSFARMPSLNVELINVVGVTEHAVNLFIEEGAEVTNKSDALAIMIMADEEQLKRTIINLIRNALQANATKVDVSIADEGDECMLRVKDNGKGIPQEIINKIFDQEFTTKIKGMGLGLSMAKRFVSSVNGSIVVESTSNNGTTILIIFPKAE